MKGLVKKSITFLTLLLSLVMAFVPAFAVNAAQTVSVQVQHKPNIEVVLAAGSSNLDVSNFETDIKAELQSKWGISGDRVKVTAVNFNWKKYDHYYAPTFPTDGTKPDGWPDSLPYYYYKEDIPYDSTYFTDASTTDDSLKYCYDRYKHIYPKDKDILFLGYSSPAFKDFMVYPDSNSGKKLIEFTIEESQIDTHTLEGAGFLFNTGITTDGDGIDRLTGYLVMYDYSNAELDSTGTYWSGKQIKLYKLTNVDVSAFHQEQGSKISDLADNGGGISLLASKDSVSTSTTLNIKIEATKNSLKLYEDSNIIYDTTPADSGIVIADTGSYGFGPLVGYDSHYCSSLTYFTYKNITMTTESVKSFLDVVREPDWQDNTRKFIVNLDDDGVPDFADGQKLAEILYRMINQDISYIGWGLNNTVPGVTPDITNGAQAAKFIAGNNGKGTFINQSPPGPTTYADGISAIADYIKDQVQTPDSADILLNEPYSFVFDPAALTGTWRIDHDPYYPKNDGTASWDNQVLTAFPATFDKSGKYQVNYTDGTTEQTVTDITASWRPVASFTYDPGTKAFTDSSYDPNGTALTPEWKWKEVSDGSWTAGEPVPADFNAPGNYLVQLRVQNAAGTWSIPCALYISNNVNALPIAAFTLPANVLNTATGPSAVTPTNNSYHPAGSGIDEYKWEVYNSSSVKVLNYSVATPVIDFVNQPSDTYSIRLSVRTSGNWSEVFSQSLTVTAPIIFNPNGGTSQSDSASTVVTAAGGDSNYASLEYQWTTSSDFPTDEEPWTSFKSGDTISIHDVTGNYYLHIKAIDELDAEKVTHATSHQFVLGKTVPSGGGGGGGYVSPRVERTFGSDRYETAVAVSRAGWDKADTVVLTRGDEYVDALAGVPLAYKLNAPILLTPTGTLSDAAKLEITRLNASKVIILGGTGAVSEAVAADITKLGLQLERIGGSDRFDTAAKIAGRVSAGRANTAAIANGKNFPDALAVASYAAVKGYPILMVDTGSIPSVTSTAINDLGVKNTIVVGGTGVINQGIFDLLPSGTRIGGIDRYSTALKLADYFVPSLQQVFVATGLDFPDAITGAVLAAKRNSGIVYVPGNLNTQPLVPADILQFIRDKRINKISVLGGPGAINEATVSSLKNLPN